MSLVCSFCQSTIALNGNEAEVLSKSSAVFQNFSPLQIGTSGFYNKQKFTIYGRIQIQYSAGFWNEWYCVFDDGNTAWLSESNDGFVFVHNAISEAISSFEECIVGYSSVIYTAQNFILVDKREIHNSYIKFEGEIPYKLDANSTQKYTDWRCRNFFLTVDYSKDSKKPDFFFGTSVNLDELKLENTRDEAQIIDTAFSLKQAYQSDNCPHCSGIIRWPKNRGINHIICEYCRSKIELTENKLNLISDSYRKNSSFDNLHSLKLGMTANYLNYSWQIIGLVCKNELEPDSNKIWGVWVEYLLYCPEKGFLWITENNLSEWTISETLDTWPECVIKGDKIIPSRYKLLAEYVGEVAYAFGAFYWQIKEKDRTAYSDFSYNREKISIEQTFSEIAISKQIKISKKEVAKIFNIKESELSKNISKLVFDDEDEKQGFFFSLFDKFFEYIFQVLFYIFIFILFLLIILSEENDDDRSFSGGYTGSSHTSHLSSHK
ncbi:MAG: DUF4178 domain-containing protein [Cardiobacteriaceae bacterium]|nr:DUF4178 domain-containing protein [Cardiobacteriaceae bacterium]